MDRLEYVEVLGPQKERQVGRTICEAHIEGHQVDPDPRGNNVRLHSAEESAKPADRGAAIESSTDGRVVDAGLPLRARQGGNEKILAVHADEVERAVVARTLAHSRRGDPPDPFVGAVAEPPRS